MTIIMFRMNAINGQNTLDWKILFEMRTDKNDSDTGSGRDGKVEKKGKVVNILGNIALIFST